MRAVLGRCLVIVLLCSACAAPPAPSPSIDPVRSEQWKRDHYRCLQESVAQASQSYITAPIAQARLQKRLYQGCMAVSGY